MSPGWIIGIILGLVLLLLLVGAPVKPLRFIGQLSVRFIVGALLLFLINVVGSSFNFHIPINGVTASVSGILGVPGVVMLVLVKQFIL
ncbi:pro-sigmaK processing inhibitor BofA family protein [Alkalihalobacillus pseudalcaliphilus]|uniref:pro-sigmaK processing inhibitor BofA family protein n=1 Tax=Alkalihalobacillus pseudalcaliphilus TaxID=79884 RepID=UPI00064D9DD7|nr:pro-sigmaK processing inhibitor BofA family protein [Alkalihalobacillus pseudalcaliphilus]KMK74443.1 sigma-K factor-processing regulatory protein BofA [Alkalihalobacillus pseudalcaliphilus]